MGEKRRFFFVQSRDLLHILRGDPLGPRRRTAFDPAKGYQRSVGRGQANLESNYPGIMLTDSEKYYDTGVFNRAEAENIPLVSLDYRGKVHSGLKNVPFDVNFPVPYGLMYPLTPSDVVKEFVTEVESLINIPKK